MSDTGKSFTMKQLEEHLKKKQIETLTEALEEIESDQELTPRELAVKIWEAGIRGVYRV